jgi:hypothetical protein
MICTSGTEEGSGKESIRHGVSALGDTDAFRARFIADALAAIGQEERYDKAQTALREYLYALAPWSRSGDFQGDGVIALPSPYRILIEPSILYGYYRAWLRRGHALSSNSIPQEKLNRGGKGG